MQNINSFLRKPKASIFAFSVMVLLLVSGGFYYVFKSKAAGEEQIANGKQGYALSAAHGSTANMAFDGTNDTAWQSDNKDNQWVCVDLGSVRSFSHVLVDWRSGYHAKTWAVMTHDETKWTVAFKTLNGIGAAERADMPTGTKGDGITDDTAAIQRAINELPVSATLVGEADKWYLVSSVYLKSNMTLANIKLLAKPTHETNILQSVVNIGKWYEKTLKKDIIIRDIEINGQRSKFTNIRADEDGGKHGIKVVGRAENITIERVQSHHNATDGLMIHQGVGNIPDGYDVTEPLIKNITVRDSVFNYNRRCGISAQSLDGALFDRVITNYNDTDIDQTEGGRGITMNYTGSRFAQGMDIESDGKPGQQSKNVTVQNSESRGNATQGFCVSEHLPPSDANYRPHENIKFIGNVADSGNVPGRDLFGIIIFNDKRTDPKKGYNNIVIRDNKLNDGGVALISVDGAIVANNEMKVSDGTALFADYTNAVTLSNNISNGVPVFTNSTNHTIQ
ncbi:MAG: hypothetical protein UT66_C0057G0007 [candidate division CPR2 bacterium GW2011_GWC1_39_9]|nr:MAG: hypothetical protein UT66_C0057G0007 [candidate division CPR2 bacterium GW2011_GWC1_39_9]